MEFLVAAGIMGGLGIGLSILLAIANKKLFVYEDPRIDQVDDLLPHANCGACGFAGCRAFAEALVAGATSPAKCTVSAAETQSSVATLLGVDVGAEEKRVARLACAGGSHVAWQRAQYEGLTSCRGAALVSGGGKGCAWGCLGLGDCAVSCDFGAITMNAYGLPVVDLDKCTACGDCVEACPKDLFSIHTVSHRVWVACKSLASGDDAEAECDVACTACGRCAADAPGGAIAIRNNLAVVDYSKNHLLKQDVIQRCPTGAIVWLDDRRGAVKGIEAKKVTRKSPLPVQAGR